MGVEELKKLMLQVKDKVEKDPAINTKDIIEYIQVSYGETLKTEK